MALLVLDRITAGYGSIPVLDRLSLSVAATEIVALLGANGSGKSTALKTAIGLTRVFDGRVVFDGADISNLAAHQRAARGIGFVPQTENVFADLSVDENLRMGGYLRAGTMDKTRNEVFDLFPRLGDRRRQLAGSLSGGERRMLSIALTLLLEPKLLLLDEPSSDLAPNTVDLVFDTIRRIHQEMSIPILLVEQNVDMALGLADRVCVLVRGREALACATEEVEMDTLRELFLDGGSGEDR